MTDFRRRRATKEEIEQGQKEIRLADERMKTEAESRGEMPIQNGPEEKPEDVEKGEPSPPKEDKRDEPPRGTPARSSNQGSGVKALLPPTQPPPDPPALSVRQEVVNSLVKNTPADKGEGKFTGGPFRFGPHPDMIVAARSTLTAHLPPKIAQHASTWPNMGQHGPPWQVEKVKFFMVWRMVRPR
jgi:hypothetical protein